MPDTVINSKIYKKTGTDAYVLYHPETGAEQVIYDKTWDGTHYTTVSGILDTITTQLDGVTGVLEFKGDATSLADAKSKAGTNAKGEVYVITSSFTWKGQTFPANTLIVFTVDVPSATPTDNEFVPLGGSNEVYARKTEAVGSITITASGLQYTNVANTTTQTVGGLIGTTNIGTVGIAATSADIVSGSSQLVTAGAVYSFASSAGQVKVSAATEGYLIGVGTYASTDRNLAKAPLDFNIHVTGGTATTPTLAANISGKANTAGVADQVIVTTYPSTSPSAALLVATDTGATSALLSSVVWFPQPPGQTVGQASGYMLTNILGNAETASSASYAATAGKINTTATNEDVTYYITFVDGSGKGKTVYVDSATTPLSYNPNTNTINANISGNAATATTANNANIATLAESLRSSLSIFGQSYDGSTAKTIIKGNGLTVTTTAGSNTTTVSVGGGDGITVNENGLSVNNGAGLSFNNGALKVKPNGSNTIKVNGDGVGLETSGVAAGTYSAVQVDTYGRATAGGQSVVFANSTSDPDLNQLVVGGLAFVSSSETAKTGTVPTNSINLNN